MKSMKIVGALALVLSFATTAFAGIGAKEHCNNQASPGMLADTFTGSEPPKQGPPAKNQTATLGGAKKGKQ